MSAFGAAFAKGLAGLGGPGAAAAIVAGGIIVGALGGGLVATQGSGQQPASATGKLAVYACPDNGAPLVMIQAGQRLLVTGRTEDSAWLRIHFPEPGRTEAWVQASPLQVDGAVASLPVAGCAPELTVAAPSIEPGMTLTAVANNPPSAPPSSSPEVTPPPEPTPSPSVSASASASPSVAPNARPTLAKLTVSTGRISYDTGNYCPSAVKKVTFRVRAGDEVGVQSVALFWREPRASSFATSPMTRASGNTRSGTWQVTLDTTANGITKAGKLAFYAVATDGQGATRRIPTSGSNSITVAVCVNTGPSIKSASSSAGSTLYVVPVGAAGGCTTTTNITAAVNDAQGIKSVMLYFRRPGGAWDRKVMNDQTVPNKWYANLDTLGDGIQSTGTLGWYIKAIDKLGASARTKTFSIAVKVCDTQPPVIAGITLSQKVISTGGTCAPTSLSVTAGVTDSPSGVGSVRIRLRNTQTRGMSATKNAAKAPSGWATNWTGSELGPATWNVEVWAKDKAGNTTGWVPTRSLFSVVSCG